MAEFNLVLLAAVVGRFEMRLFQTWYVPHGKVGWLQGREGPCDRASQRFDTELNTKV